MFCWNCGKEIDDKAYFCIHCGVKTDRSSNNRVRTASPDDASSAGYGVLGFFFPIVGLILWLIWNNDYPKRAKSAGLGALISVLSGVILTVIVVAIVVPIVVTGAILY
ncbi:MAG: zinc ribbon domain-containing protein [Clostridia bacterium]|nr:zinc ribbon domain-containing protein [Clostridia bacterium]